MSRVSIHIDETRSAVPIPVLVVNGQELRMSDSELEGLMNEVLWAKDCMCKLRANHFKSLASKYMFQELMQRSSDEASVGSL